MDKPKFLLLDEAFTVHRFPPDTPVPDVVSRSRFYWIGRTDEELSIVCAASITLPGLRQNAGWSCFKVQGPIDFPVTGLIHGISAAFAEADIPILAVSTFDTDYILVRNRDIEQAKHAIEKAVYPLVYERIRPQSSGSAE